MLAVTGMSEFHSETESAEETGLAIQEFQAVSPRQHAFHFRVQAEGKVVPDGKTDVVSRCETVFMVPVIQEGLAVRDKLNPVRIVFGKLERVLVEKSAAEIRPESKPPGTEIVPDRQPAVCKNLS